VVSSISIIGVDGIPEVVPGNDLSKIILEACEEQRTPLQPKDIVVVTQKIVSKAEGEIVDLSTVVPSDFASRWADRYDKDARVIELALQDSRRIVRMDRGVLVTETQHGFFCVNSGIDASNVSDRDAVVLLPKDSDASARHIRDGINKLSGLQVAIIITDTWGRPWRKGVLNVAIGVAGIDSIRDYRGLVDDYGRELHGTAIAVVDELASAGELVMGKLDRIPVAIVRGYSYKSANGSVSDMIRPADEDIFR
jgi:coenzyme F420-0:L-glutamate ligase/coenzyme F420-1:gamma-L-glutamate ligase